MKIKNVCVTFVLLIVMTQLIAKPAFAVDYQDYLVVVDEHDRPLPTEGWYFNNVGGDRGVIYDPVASSISYTRRTDTAYKTRLTSFSGLWGWFGSWYALDHINSDNSSLNFKAIFGPYISPEHQGEITEIRLHLDEVITPNGYYELRIELKNNFGGLVCQNTWANPAAGELVWVLPEHCKGNIGEIVWLADLVQTNDSISVDSIKLKARVPILSTEEQAFLWTYSWLMKNYDPFTGMIQDRSNFNFGQFENITATAKAAKITYYAYLKGYITLGNARTIITKIASTLINVVPRGPLNINSVWPHFTKGGGNMPVPPSAGGAGTEWASGDTSYAALDLIAALEMLGDPSGQLEEIVNFVLDIDWQSLRIGNYISHGYYYHGGLIPFTWQGFGMETVGVNWAYKAATGNLASMYPPPTDNGSGFIDNAHYPVVLTGTDLWGNNWDQFRANQADIQINWFNQPGSFNQYFSGAGLYGLSASEIPDGTGYIAYGTGGLGLPQDGNHEVIALHYAAMIADIRPTQAKHVWEILRDKNATFLQNARKIVISPLNNLESMRVNKLTGAVTVNSLRGSWNLALQAEGWALADPMVKQALAAAVKNNSFLNIGLNSRLSGDFDGDGDVDGNDFLAWQRGIGTSNPSVSDGDANGDGKVDKNDLTEWRENYGETVSIEATAAQAVIIPESTEFETGPINGAQILSNSGNTQNNLRGKKKRQNKSRNRKSKRRGAPPG